MNMSNRQIIFSRVYNHFTSCHDIHLLINIVSYQCKNVRNQAIVVDIEIGARSETIQFSRVRQFQ